MQGGAGSGNSLQSPWGRRGVEAHQSQQLTLEKGGWGLRETLKASSELVPGRKPRTFPDQEGDRVGLEAVPQCPPP